MPPLYSSPITGPANSSRNSRTATITIVNGSMSSDGGRDPAELGDADDDGVADRRATSLRIRHGDPDPQADEGDPHDDIPGDQDPVVELLARVEAREHTRDPEDQDDDADHLHQGREPEQPVVVVERGGEPGVVDPGPADREHREHEAAQTAPDVPLGEVVRELGRGGAEGDDERQVVQQLEGRRRTLALIRVAPEHAAQVVIQSRSGHAAQDREGG